MYSLCGQTYTERKGSFLSLVPSRQLACDTEVVTIQITGRMWHFLFNQWFWITSYIDHCFLSLLWFVIKRVRLLMCSWPLPSLWWRTHVHSYFSSPLEFFLQVRKPCSVELKSWVMMTCPLKSNQTSPTTKVMSGEGSNKKDSIRGSTPCVGPSDCSDTHCVCPCCGRSDVKIIVPWCVRSF